MLRIGDEIAIVCCSNPQSIANREKIKDLIKVLEEIKLTPIISEYIFEDSYGDGAERGKALMDFYKDKDIKAIFDISGGDIANEVLDYLDYKVIKNNPKPFFGYSDLTTIINAIYTKTNNKSYLYQVRNLIYTHKEEQINNFKKSIFENKEDLFKFEYYFVQGNSLEGVVVGGNIRCLLKLAGTEYMPCFKGKVLLLEGMSGKVPQIKTFLTQLKQLGILKDVKGIILGSFTEMERDEYKPTVEELVKKSVDNVAMPIVKTKEIGHGTDSKCIIIGEEYRLVRS